MRKFLTSNPYWLLCATFGFVELCYLVDLGISMLDRYAHFDGDIQTLVYVQRSTALLFVGFGLTGVCASMLGGMYSRWKPRWILAVLLTAFPTLVGGALVVLRVIGLSGAR